MHHSTKNNHLSSTPQPKRVVLIGGGHAHVQVIKSLNAHLRPSYVHVTLIDLQSSASYSGMVPGCISKLYTLDQVQIALDSLADWSRIDFVCGKVVGMNFDEHDGQKVVFVEGTDEDGNVTKKEIPFDVVSVDIGSTTRDFTSIPGASEYTISTRPISDLVQRIQKEEEMLKGKLSTGGMLNGAQIVVVGGGAAGIELSLALRARWNDLLDSKLSITLIDSNDKLIPSESSACRSALVNVMEKYDVVVRHDLIVEEVTSSHVHVMPVQKLKSKFGDVLKGLQGHPHGWVFNSPVDPMELGLPDYFEVIEKPMDLGTVKKQLDNGVYRSLTEVERDVCLTFENAMLYNPEGSMVWNMANELKLKFVKDYEILLTQLHAEEEEKRKNGDASIAKSVGSSNPKDRLPYTHCIWATGAEAHELSWALHEQCGLSVSPHRGWIRVNQHMQSLSHPSVFAVGDCCEIVNENRKSPPKAGVYAVRSGPILIENLTRFLGANAQSKTDGEASKNDLITYHPQDDFLKLLMCGDGTALGFRFGVPFYGKWVWELKDHIDRMFMDLFDVENLLTYTKSDPGEKEEGNEEDYDTSQYDTYEAVKERMEAEDAGKLLLRRDDEVNFHMAWSVIREMMADENYKEEVLTIVRHSPDSWW